MQVREIMSQPVITVPEDASLEEVARTILENNFGGFELRSYRRFWTVNSRDNRNGFDRPARFYAGKGDTIMNRNFLRNTFTGLAAVGGIGALAAGYFLKVRPWHLRWGATDEELTEILPGDEVKPDAAIQVTHAITINAPAKTVWKWLVQIGQERGGFYSYDWLENVFGLQVHNTDEINPEWQKLEVGDFVRSAHKGWLGGRFDDVAGWFVVRLEPNRALVLRDEIERGSWAFVLREMSENQTRLIIRARGNAPASLGGTMFHYSFFEPAHFIMERKMLLTLKEKAEESAADERKKPELLRQAVKA